jgi:hypothetical protein
VVLAALVGTSVFATLAKQTDLLVLTGALSVVATLSSALQTFLSSEGTIIEEYPDDQRVLICGKTTLAKTTDIYLHVVCEYADAIYVEFVTAYIPDEQEWAQPPFRRRKQKRR